MGSVVSHMMHVCMHTHTLCLSHTHTLKDSFVKIKIKADLCLNFYPCIMKHIICVCVCVCVCVSHGSGSGFCSGVYPAKLTGLTQTAMVFPTE